MVAVNNGLDDARRSCVERITRQRLHQTLSRARATRGVRTAVRDVPHTPAQGHHLDQAARRPVAATPRGRVLLVGCSDRAVRWLLPPRLGIDHTSVFRGSQVETSVLPSQPQVCCGRATGRLGAYQQMPRAEDHDGEGPDACADRARLRAT
jgi:hypothetical protein